MFLKSYSFDYGLTWDYIKIRNCNISQLFIGKNQQNFMINFYAKNSINNNIYIFQFNFGAFLGNGFLTKVRECSKSDYSIFQPAPTDDLKCFQGLKNFHYKKNKYFCKGILKNLEKIPQKNCKCSIYDYKW